GRSLREARRDRRERQRDRVGHHVSGIAEQSERVRKPARYRLHGREGQREADGEEKLPGAVVGVMVVMFEHAAMIGGMPRKNEVSRRVVRLRPTETSAPKKNR